MWERKMRGVECGYLLFCHARCVSHSVMHSYAEVMFAIVPFELVGFQCMVFRNLCHQSRIHCTFLCLAWLLPSFSITSCTLECVMCHIYGVLWYFKCLETFEAKFEVLNFNPYWKFNPRWVASVASCHLLLSIELHPFCVLSSNKAWIVIMNIATHEYTLWILANIACH